MSEIKKMQSFILKDENCPICLDKFIENNNYTLTKCGHWIHSDCYGKYIYKCTKKSNPYVCPICRTKLFEEDIEEDIHIEENYLFAQFIISQTYGLDTYNLMDSQNPFNLLGNNNETFSNIIYSPNQREIINLETNNSRIESIGIRSLSTSSERIPQNNEIRTELITQRSLRNQENLQENNSQNLQENNAQNLQENNREILNSKKIPIWLAKRSDTFDMINEINNLENPNNGNTNVRSLRLVSTQPIESTQTSENNRMSNSIRTLRQRYIQQNN